MVLKKLGQRIDFMEAVHHELLTIKQDLSKKAEPPKEAKSANRHFDSNTRKNIITSSLVFAILTISITVFLTNNPRPNSPKSSTPATTINDAQLTTPHHSAFKYISGKVQQLQTKLTSAFEAFKLKNINEKGFKNKFNTLQKHYNEEKIIIKQSHLLASQNKYNDAIAALKLSLQHLQSTHEDLLNLVKHADNFIATKEQNDKQEAEERLMEVEATW